MKEFWLMILHFLFPLTCVECARDLPFDDSYGICEMCKKNIKTISGLFCRKCGLSLPDGGEHCYTCRKGAKYHFENIRSACVYEDISKSLVHKFKYRGKEHLDKVLVSIMGRVLEEEKYESKIDLVVFVPMHWLKEYLRGYNQAELLANRVSALLGKPVVKCLVRAKLTRAQFRLKREERKRNIEGCFGVKRKAGSVIKGKNLLLIDDVCTTCATIEECSRALRASGAGKVYGLTFARD